jgi:hypothetical protein
MPTEAELDDLQTRVGLLEAAARRAARYLEEHDERLRELERSIHRRQFREHLEESARP